jgi:enoyl-CoA hydratase/carnithine racemase
MTASAELVETSVTDSVAWLTLNDPSRRNCVSAAMSLAVEERCRALADDRDVHAVVLTGRAPAFSAGGDVDSLSRRDNPLEVFYRGFAALAALPVPTVAAVNGPAVGAGVNFALACDVVLAGESAHFDPSFLDIGIHPGGGHLWRLQQRIGAQAATALVLFGESLTGRQAETAGLAWRCVADHELADTAQRLAARAARRSPELVRRTKASLRAEMPLTNEREAVEVELIAQRWSMTRPAFADGVRALRERLAARG